jgi:hypothetical protein
MWMSKKRLFDFCEALICVSGKRQCVICVSALKKQKMCVGKKQNFIRADDAVGSHSALYFFFKFVCSLVNFHVAVFVFTLACNIPIYAIAFLKHASIAHISRVDATLLKGYYVNIYFGSTTYNFL